MPQTGVFNPFASVENQEQFGGSKAVYHRDWAYNNRHQIKNTPRNGLQTIDGLSLWLITSLPEKQLVGLFVIESCTAMNHLYR